MRLRWVLGVGGLAGVACVVFSGCVGRNSAPVSADCTRIERFFRTDLEGYQKGVDAASEQYSLEQWRVETADPASSPETLSRLFASLQKQTYDAKTLERARALAKLNVESPLEVCPWTAKLERAVQILEAQIVTDPAVVAKEQQNQALQKDLERQNNSFRIGISSGSETISKALYLKALASEPERPKREALFRKWNSSRAKKWAQWGFRDLIHSRNEEAKLAGFPTYFEYRFFRNQLDFANYRELSRSLKTTLAPTVRRWIQSWAKSEKIANVQPWDLAFLRERAVSASLNEWMAGKAETFPIETATLFFEGLGFSIGEYHFTMDLAPRAGKSAHAYAFPIVLPHVDWSGNLMVEPKPDIRFLANLKTPLKWDDVRTVIHELGHAIDAAEVRQPVGLFRESSAVESEALAVLLERIASTPSFLESAFATQMTGRARGILARQNRGFRWEQAHSLLRQVFYSEFEYEMYHRPDADLGELWSRLHAEYWGVEIKSAEAGWDVEHFVMAPVYVQNYAIGILMVEQLNEYIEQTFSNPRSKEVGDKLRSIYFAPGREFGYLDIVKRFTGKPLSVDAALRLTKE